MLVQFSGISVLKRIPFIYLLFCILPGICYSSFCGKNKNTNPVAKMSLAFVAFCFPPVFPSYSCNFAAIHFDVPFISFNELVLSASKFLQKPKSDNFTLESFEMRIFCGLMS